MRYLPPLNALRAFEAAARHQNLSRAAEELNVSRTAVSQQVKQLELYLNAKLFIRQGSLLQLTDQATHYLPLLSNSFDALSNGTVNLFERNKKQQLTLRVAQSFCQQWLLPRLADFKRQYPDVCIKILTTNQLYPQQNDSVDIEIINGYGDWSQPDTIKLSDESWFVVATPSLQKQLNLQTLEEIALTEKITTFGYHEKWQDWFDVQKFKGKINEPTLQFENSQLAIEAALNGLGILFVRSLLVENELKEGLLVKLSNVALSSKSYHYLLCQPANVHKKVVKDFKQWLIEGFSR